MRVRVLVRIKPAILDPQGQTVLQALHRLGYDEVRQVRIGKLIELELDGSGDVVQRVEEMGRKLLANPLIETFEIQLEDAAPGSGSSPTD